MRLGPRQLLPLLALAACSSGGHDELPAFPGPPDWTGITGVISPSTTSTTTSEAGSVVTPPPTPDWRVSPPTVLVYVAAPAPRPAHRHRRADPPAPPTGTPPSPAP